MFGPSTNSDADAGRTVGDVLRWGVVDSVDHGTGRAVVKVGELKSGPLRWAETGAAGVTSWSPPAVGEQVMVACPEGEIEAGLILGRVHSDKNPRPSSSADAVLLRFPDGAEISYDHAAHALTAVLPAGGVVAITATGGLTIDATEGGVTITGDLSVDGLIKATGDVQAEDGDVSLKLHKHTLVQPGSGKSGPPE